MMQRRNPYEKLQDSFEATAPKDGRRFAEDIIAKAQAAGMPVEKDPEILRETGDLELEKQVPPQVYAVVAGVMDLIRKIEEEGPHEGDQGDTRRQQRIGP